MRTLIAAALATATLSACSILPDPKPAPIIYRPTVDGASVDARPDATVVRIDRPGGSTIFNTVNVLVTPDGRRMSQASGSRWSEQIPLLVQETLVDALSRSPALVGVLPSSGARTDTRVHLTIKNFEAVFDQGEGAAPLATVRYTATLANASDRALIDTHTVMAQQRADAINVSEIVEAMEAANSRAMMDIVAWLERQAAQGEI